MKYSQLIEKCIELLETYDQNLMTPDSHAEGFLSSLKCEDTQRVFLKQVFYGCERYRGFIKASNTIIFTQFAGSTNRKNDGPLFSIFTYLICFRLDELPFAEFKKMILSQDSVKMNVLLSFLFDFQTLKNKVFPVWQQHLELDYLEGKLLPKLVERKQKCEELLGKVAEAATGKRQEGSLENTQQVIEGDRKKVTVPVEFNLTKPRPKLIPELQKIEVGFKANPAPQKGKDLKVIEDQKIKRRKQIQSSISQFYQQNKKKEFQLQTSKRPTNLPKIKEQVERSREIKKKVTAKPMPKYEDVEVKLNVAAILRQQKKLNEKIQEEQRRMKDLQVNMRDESEFQNWKKEMRQKDKYEQLEAQQRRKIQMELAREAAVKAYEQKIDEKRALVDDMKQIALQLKAERQKLQAETLEGKKKVVQQVQQIQEAIRVQQEKVLEKNRKIHDDQKQERKRIQQKKKEQERVEILKKKQLIQQIRELQKKIRARPRQQIEYVSIGLLEEMTLEQLQVKLHDVKRQRRQQQQRRRQTNIKKKQQFKETLGQKKEAIFAHREQLAKQKEEERRKKKEEVEAEKHRLAQVKQKSINEYKKKQQKKGELKKIQKEKLAKQIKETQQRRMFLAQGQAQQEANAFLNLQKGEQRQMLDRQNDKLVEQYRLQSVKEGQMKILADQNQREVQKKFNKLYREQEQVRNQAAEELRAEDQASKAVKYQQVRVFEQKHNENMIKTNPYRTKVSEMSLSKAKMTLNQSKAQPVLRDTLQSKGRSVVKK